MTDEEMEYEESSDGCCWKKPKMPYWCDGNVGEYKLDKINISETGFTVIIDPIVPQGFQPDEVQFNDKEIASKDRNKEWSYKNISWETQTMPCGQDGDVVEYRLDTISLSETGFSVIIDPLVPQGYQLGDHLPEVKSKCKAYKCNGCEKYFPTREQAIVHQRNHIKSSPDQCAECGKIFFHSYGLVSHMRVHTGEKPYSCDICGKSFSQRTTYIRHKSTHTGERHYTCNVCDKRFIQRASLVIHQRTHTGERPYTCNECDKSFAQRSTYIKHKRTHTGEKPYGCDECGRWFRAMYSLSIHKRTHSKEKPFKCSKCDKSFSQSSTLTKHLKFHE